MSAGKADHAEGKEAGAVEAEEPPAPTVEINGASYPALADGEHVAFCRSLPLLIVVA